MLRQETCKKERKIPVTPPVVASNTGLENQYLLPVDSTQTGSDLSGHSSQQLLLSPNAGRSLNVPLPSESVDMGWFAWGSQKGRLISGGRKRWRKRESAIVM